MFGDNLKRFGSGMKYGCKIGKHSNIPDSAFDPKELALGIKTELEHTDDVNIAKGIAKDHLMEFKDYYTRLTKARL